MHRFSLDVDGVTRHLQSEYETLLVSSEDWPGWRTNFKNPPVLILGERHGVELGVRQLRRTAPLRSGVGRSKFIIMTSDIRKLVHAVPFVPFTIHLADGGALRVPSVDHIAVPPAGGRVFVFGDDDRYDVISSLLISRLAVDRESASSTGGKPAFGTE